MDALQAFWHLVNLLAPGFVVGALTAALAKLGWRRAWARASGWNLAAWAAAAGMLSQVVSLAVMGRDGTMVGHGMLVLAVALVLWWRAPSQA